MALAFLLYAAFAAASSFPDTTTCSVDDPNLGVTVMDWTSPPVRTDAYTLRTADGCGIDSTTYVPGEMTSIHLRTHKYKGQFRGLLIYATDMSGNRVGDWHLDWPNSNMFWKPGGFCQNRSLMHLNGAEKYYHHEFKFIAPPPGTGRIEFHTLIKRGEANLGEFYWANLEENLSLDEGRPATGNVWVQGEVGTSCAQACASKSLTCDSSLLNNAYKWAGALQRDVLKTVGCHWPALTDDNASTISKDGNGWCTYPSPLSRSTTGACDVAAPAETSPICPCGSAGLPSFGATVPPPDTACLNLQVVMGSASKSSASFVSLFLVLVSGAFLNQRKQSNFLLTLVCVLFCAYSVQAHNWVFSVSRSFNQASTYKPCRPKVTDVPHWQINQGQEFTMEWATGHDHYFYFTVVRADDIAALENTTQNHLDNYIKSCTDANDYMIAKGTKPGAPWHKQHITTSVNSIRNDLYVLDSDPIYSRNISSTDPAYIVRHEKFGTFNNEVRWLYKPKYVSKDRRCSYYNPTYPHIFAVHRFEQVRTVEDDRASQRDIARFTIEFDPDAPPGAQGPPSGQFLVQYLWRGYFDCADVDLFPASTPVAKIGGRPLLPHEPQWNKVDHCQFEEIQNLESGCSEVVTNADRCLKACLGRTNCGGVNVVPLWLPKTVYPLFSDRVGIPWTTEDWRGCDRSDFQNLGRDARVCYGVLPRFGNNTHAEYSVSDDPEDPLFYSTCFVKKSQWTFDLSLGNSTGTAPPPVPPAWNFGGKCVDCMEWKASQENFNIPTWVLPEHCVNCDTATLPPVPAVAGALIAKGAKCDGQWSGSALWSYQKPTDQCAAKKCTKTLSLVGANDMKADECIAKAKADPDCSEFVQHRGNGLNNNGCECFLKDPCCGSCVPVDSYFANWQWNIYTTKKQTGDPLCEQGVKSADGVYCCSSTCKDANGVGSCMPVPGLQVSFQGIASANPEGWAVDNGRQFGPRSTLGYTSTLSSTFGWNCDLGNSVTDFNNDDRTNYHSTAVRPDTGVCGLASTLQPTWSVSVPNGVYQVDTLYSVPNAQMRGCKIQDEKNYDRDRLYGNDMAWVSRTVNTTDGKLSLTGGTNNGCSAYTAVVIYPEATVQSRTYCQELPGMCCPLLIDMENRPCTSFDPPCKL